VAEKDSGPELFKPNQVCARLDIQPYQLKFWESEFAELGKRVGTRREYDAEALEVAPDVKRLLVDGRMNLGEARQILAERYAIEDAGEAQAATAAAATSGAVPTRSAQASLPSVDETEPPAPPPKPDEALKRRLKRAEEAALQARQRASALEAEVEDLRRDAEENESEARRELLHEKGRATELTTLLEAAETKIAALEEKLGKERTKSTSGKESLASVNAELECTRKELHELRGSREEAEKRLETLNAELLERAREVESLRRLMREEGGALEGESGRLALLAEELLVSLSWAGHSSPESAEGGLDGDAPGGSAEASRQAPGKPGEEAPGKG
jgi:DNA-binding transcriptional MerR regulator